MDDIAVDKYMEYLEDLSDLQELQDKSIWNVITDCKITLDNNTPLGLALNDNTPLGLVFN